MIKIKDLKKEPLSVLEALALSVARDIDRGDRDLKPLLERIFDAIPTAKTEIVF